MKGYVVLGVLVSQRTKDAVAVQDVLTKYGCIIKMRLGLHETTNVCAEDALLLLQLDGLKEEIKASSFKSTIPLDKSFFFL
jgi:hypothetical protein